MKKFLRLFLHSIKSFDDSKRPEEMEDWKELMGNLVLFLLCEVIIIFLFITFSAFSLFEDPSTGGHNILLLSFYFFTIVNLVANILLAITAVIIIFVKKRKSHLKDEEKEDPDWSIKLKAWGCEHRPWI